MVSLESGWLVGCEGGYGARAVLSILHGQGVRGGLWEGILGTHPAEGMFQALPRSRVSARSRGLAVPLLSCPSPAAVTLGLQSGFWGQELLLPTRNTWRTCSMCPLGPNPACSHAGLHRARVPSIPR